MEQGDRDLDLILSLTIIYILWVISDQAADVMSAKPGAPENIAQHSPGSSVILKSATVRQFQTVSNYSIKLLKENAPMPSCHVSVHGEIFMACCAECCRYCSMMTVQKRTGTQQSVIRWPLYTDIISGAGDHYNAVSLMTWTTCETLRVESHMEQPLLIWEAGVKNREAHENTDNKMALSLN